MKTIVSIIILFFVFALQGCAAIHPAMDDDAYVQWLDTTVERIKNNPSYVRIPIDTDEQMDQFVDLSYRAYKKEITKGQFIGEMEQQYPGYSESINWIAEQLP